MLEKENSSKVSLERQIYKVNRSVKATAKIIERSTYTYISS